MENDAFITLVNFDRQIRKVRCINQYIKGQLGCGHTNKKVVLKRWYDEGNFDQCEKSSLTKAQLNTTEKEEVILENNHMLITETLHDFNQDKIKPIYYPSLNKLIELIKHYPNSTLLISGHTDTKGSTVVSAGDVTRTSGRKLLSCKCKDKCSIFIESACAVDPSSCEYSSKLGHCPNIKRL